MPDRITPDDVAKVARLARLAIAPADLDHMAGELTDMIDHFRDIDDLDLDDVEPMSQCYDLVNILRDDVVVVGLDRSEVLASAPTVEDGRFRVPPIASAEG